jgi:hypothetical protein
MRNSTSEQETLATPWARWAHADQNHERRFTYSRKQDAQPRLTPHRMHTMETRARNTKSDLGRQPLNQAVSATKGKIGEENKSRDAKNSRQNRDLDVGKQRQIRATPISGKT